MILLAGAGADGPREARGGRRRSEASGPAPPADEQERAAGALHERRPRRAEPRGPPLVRDAEEQRPRAGRDGGQLVRPRGHEHRLRLGARHLLDKEARACEQPARIPSVERAPRDAGQAEGPALRRGEPRPELDRLRKVDPNGTITTIAGTGDTGLSGDGWRATSVAVWQPNSAVDEAGNVYNAELATHRVRRVDTNGFITTVAGSGVHGFDGDGGPATQARLNAPTDIAVDSEGNLYIADTGNRRIRKVSP